MGGSRGGPTALRPERAVWSYLWLLGPAEMIPPTAASKFGAPENRRVCQDLIYTLLEWVWEWVSGGFK